jgi:hypothetical protein
MALIQKSVSKAAAARRLQDDERVLELERVVQSLGNREEYAGEITRLWGQAQEKFILIGKYLMQAKIRLPHGEYEDMIARDLPFGKKAAHMIRAAAEAIESGRLHANEVPPNYSVVYALATLTDDQLTLARSQGLVNPKITRPKIFAFKRSFLPPPDADRSDRSLLLEQLREQRRRLDEEIHRLEEEIGCGVTIDGTSRQVDEMADA